MADLKPKDSGPTHGTRPGRSPLGHSPSDDVGALCTECLLCVATLGSELEPRPLQRIKEAIARFSHA